MIVRLWWGAILVVLLGLFLLSGPYLAGAYYLQRGAQTLARGDNYASIAHFKTALHFEPNNALAYRRLAQAYLQSSQPERALEVAQQALYLDSNNPIVQLEIGDVYDRLGNNEQATTHYEAGGVGDRTAQLAANYLQLADQLWANGDQDRAVAIWRDKVRGTGYGDLYANWRLARYFADDEERAKPYQDGAHHFSLKSISVSPDPRLEVYQVQAIEGVVADGLWTHEQLVNVISYLVWSDQSKYAARLLHLLLAKNPDDVDLHFYLGELYHRRGDEAKAVTTYLQLLEMYPHYAQAHLRLGMMAEAKCQAPYINCEDNLKEAAKWYKQYYEITSDHFLAPKKLVEINKMLGFETEAAKLKQEWLDRMAQDGPTVIVSQTLESGWVFLGYRADENRLLRGEPGFLGLYWQGQPDHIAGSEEQGWYSLGDNRWIQLLEEANNLVFNGTFELGLENGSPTGFPNDLYGADLATHKLSAEDRNGIPTVAAALENTARYNRTGLVSLPIPIDPNALYLQAGWIFSVGGNGFLGRHWQGKDKSKYNYVVTKVQSESWQHYASIAQPLSGANQAQIWLLNFKATGRTYFDDIMFIKVGRPGK